VVPGGPAGRTRYRAADADEARRLIVGLAHGKVIPPAAFGNGVGPPPAVITVEVWIDDASGVILDVPAWEQADNMPVTDDPLFIVAVRFGDDVSEGVALEKKMQRLTAVDAGSFNEGSSDSQGHAWLCGNSLASWIELDG
jgi:hypothetical protein